MLSSLDTDFLKSVDPVAFSRIDLLFTPDEVQSRFLRDDSKRKVLNCHRQWGKSQVTAILGLHRAIYTPGITVLVIARSERQSYELFKKIVDMSALCPNLKKDEQSKSHLLLSNGSRILCLPGSESNIRGYSADLVIADEAARIPDETFVALLPMVLMTKGDLVLLSTPWGPSGFFHRVWTQDEGWAKFECTIDENPRLTPEIIKKERKGWTERDWRREFQCEFLAAEDGAFSPELISKIFDHGRSDVKPLVSDLRIDSNIKPFGGT